ncbi:hypothetical protein [Qipengyuania atrilutea]|uniref:Uncharacterized protein n=1 Tax=Qipengyuania atrilutea TaxID=2744473 RepID=A0A850HEY4_9SPHN|nr:hypothetical protein [Actirhodobacter atriluteus]NVD45839.1 hypothetical protein [Actirhodobacter atriluteus]
MATSFVLSGLVEKRSELLRDITIAKDTLAMLEADLVSIEGAIRVFDPELVVHGRSKRVPAIHAAPVGQMARHIFSCFREAGKPLHTAEIAEYVMKERSIDPRDKRVRDCMVRRTYGALHKMKREGKVRQQDTKAHRKTWELLA